ncbi:hypothetical protein Btru_072868 [Bulinus truncatus]|nr:hypothetical protein Btru_072868 [Bulinus truncatus]
MQGLNLGMCAVSVLHMTLISVDRFLYITQPYLYVRVVKLKPAVIALGAIWSFGFMYSLLPHFIYNTYTEPPVCDVTLVLPIGYLFYSSCTIYFSLVLVIVVMYSFILRTAYVQQKSVDAATVYPDGDKEKKFFTRKSAWKSVKFFIVVFGVFFVCLTPVVACLGIDYYYTVPGKLYRFLHLVAIMNSGMNFIIFAVLKKQFRQTFLKLLGLRVCLKTGSESQVLPFPTVMSTSFHN